MSANTISIQIQDLHIGDNYPVRLMGVLNISRESFYGKSYVNNKEIGGHAMRMIEAGAHFIDIGGRSTAPKSPRIPVELELERIRTALEILFSEV